MSFNTLIALTDGGGTILLFLAIAWLILSFVLLKIIFFPSKKYLQRAEKKKSQSKDLADSSPVAEGTTVAENEPLEEAQAEAPERVDTETATEDSLTPTPEGEDKEKEANDLSASSTEGKQSLTQALENFSPSSTLVCDKKSDVLWTYTAKNSDALEVGTAFADELQRLGYEIQSDTHETASATRNDTSLSLHIEQQETNVVLVVCLLIN